MVLDSGVGDGLSGSGGRRKWEVSMVEEEGQSGEKEGPRVEGRAKGGRRGARVEWKRSRMAGEGSRVEGESLKHFFTSFKLSGNFS